MEIVWVYTLLLCPFTWPADQCTPQTASKMVEIVRGETQEDCMLAGQITMNLSKPRGYKGLQAKPICIRYTFEESKPT